MTTRFQTTQKRISLQVIQCYAPTNDSNEDLKDHFYNKLQQIIQSRKDKDIIVLMGDMNAKVGVYSSGYKGGTVFPHKPIHKATWMSPNHMAKHQISHICINKKFRRSLLDVRVKRGADAGSDHHLLTAKIQLKLRRRNNPTDCRVKYNIHLFQDIGTSELCKTTLQNRFQSLQEEDQKTVEEHWKSLKRI